MMPATGWLALAGSILCNTGGNLLLKYFSTGRAISGPLDYVRPSFFGGIAVFGFGVMLYGRALQDIPIVLAYPIQAGTCALIIALYAVIVFGERFGLQDLLGISLIIAGIVVLCR